MLFRSLSSKITCPSLRCGRSYSWKKRKCLFPMRFVSRPGKPQLHSYGTGKSSEVPTPSLTWDCCAGFPHRGRWNLWNYPHFCNKTTFILEKKKKKKWNIGSIGLISENKQVISDLLYCACTDSSSLLGRGDVGEIHRFLPIAEERGAK